MSLKIFLLLIFAVYNSVCESDLCNYHTCGDCISNANCVWCSADEMVGDTSRCKPLSVLGTKGQWCHKDFIENPQLENKMIINKSFDEKIDGIQVQLRPQRIKIKARPGVIVPITISYQPAKDFPLDVYYLMDISYTMRNHKEALSKQALEIYKQLTEYTNNVRLGIGSFVEKPGYPYVDQVQQPPHISHAFKNHLSLTTNMTAFTTTVKHIEFGANYDDPEAGLDALMQVMTCEKDLGWRPGARRIIVLCTDSTYHSAGDGKVLGVIRPNDMKCHLENNLYNDTMALTYDYPSVSQINKVAKEGHFRVIFAAPASVATDYTKLAKHIMGAKHAFLEDESGTVTIIKDAYKESTQLMRIYKNLPPYIQLTLDQDCDTKQTRNCESTVEQKTVTVEGNLTIQYCPPDHDLKKELTIEVIGINDKVTIELDIDCKCACEKESGVQNISAKCFNAGVTQCGICKCNSGRYGDDCRCNGTSTSTTDIEKCKLPDDKNVCSGKAQCICGKCDKCEIGFSGDVCQYNDDACPNKCTGHGLCTLGRCHCDGSWFGEDCSCSLKTDTCIAPYSKEICSGNGECKCGRCKCNSEGEKNATKYTGMFCDACDDCAEKRCKELEKFVVCAVMNSTSDCVKQYDATDAIVVFVNKKDLTYGHEWYMGNKCKTQLENGSYVIFKYQYEDLNIKLGIQDEVELPPKANVFIAVASAIGIVLLIGIVTLIVWKILVDLHDKKEYERFAKESKAQGFDVSSNPLYNPPNVCIANPAFEH